MAKPNFGKPGDVKRIPCPECDGEGNNGIAKACSECGGKGYLEAVVVKKP